MGETSKAYERRKIEGWFEAYAPDNLSGIDIGCGNDPLNHTFRRWDKNDGDATLMNGIPDNCFHTVYASHILEHLEDPIVALQNWWRILQPTGHLIILVPDRDMYEKKRILPSQWNGEHKTYWLLDKYEPPCTFSFKNTIRYTIPNGIIRSLCILNEKYNSNADKHSSGEYSIEAIIYKEPK